MKVLKWFSLFFMSALVVFFIGVFIGWRLEKYFYPQTSNGSQEITDSISNIEPAVAVSGSDERISADTVYIVIERNMDTDEEVETVSRIPEMYLGMDREQFLTTLEGYEASPPLSELERGFVNLEVQSFSSSKVEVLMNYSYVKPSKSFYVVVYDGLVTVLLEDRETLYLQTGMKVLNLPEHVQQELIQGMYVPDEESLYDFLENYTS